MIYYVQSSLYNQILKTVVISSGIPVTTPDGTGFSTIIWARLEPLCAGQNKKKRLTIAEYYLFRLFRKPLYII